MMDQSACVGDKQFVQHKECHCCSDRETLTIDWAQTMLGKVGSHFEDETNAVLS